MDKFTIFRDETTTALAGFHGGPLSWSNWNFNNQEKIPQNKTTNNKLNHIILWHWTGIEPGLHWWEASILTTAPSLLLRKFWAETKNGFIHVGLYMYCNAKGKS